jgi:hypothetical protein
MNRSSLKKFIQEGLEPIDFALDRLTWKATWILQKLHRKIYLWYGVHVKHWYYFGPFATVTGQDFQIRIDFSRNSGKTLISTNQSVTYQTCTTWFEK